MSDRLFHVLKTVHHGYLRDSAVDGAEELDERVRWLREVVERESDVLDCRANGAMEVDNYLVDQ